MDEQNYLSTLDENNKPMINPAYYKNVINDYIQTYLQEHNKTPDKLTNNNMLSICNEIRERIFKNDNKRYITDKSANIPYTQFNIDSLLNIYRDILLYYNCVPSLYGFSILTGLDEGTIKKVSPSSSEILNLRREMLRNELYNDRMGRIVLANNDSSFGLEYEKKNTLERETIKQGLSVSDLPRLE